MKDTNGRDYTRLSKMKPEPWQTRVLKERKELSIKLIALSSFISRPDTIFEALDKEDKELLRSQRNVMLKYIDVLDNRIARFTEGK